MMCAVFKILILVLKTLGKLPLTLPLWRMDTSLGVEISTVRTCVSLIILSYYAFIIRAGSLQTESGRFQLR